MNLRNEASFIAMISIAGEGEFLRGGPGSGATTSGAPLVSKGKYFGNEFDSGVYKDCSSPITPFLNIV